MTRRKVARKRVRAVRMEARTRALLRPPHQRLLQERKLQKQQLPKLSHLRAHPRAPPPPPPTPRHLLRIRRPATLRHRRAGSGEVRERRLSQPRGAREACLVSVLLLGCSSGLVFRNIWLSHHHYCPKSQMVSGIFKCFFRLIMMNFCHSASRTVKKTLKNLCQFQQSLLK